MLINRLLKFLTMDEIGFVNFFCELQLDDEQHIFFCKTQYNIWQHSSSL